MPANTGGYSDAEHQFTVMEILDNVKDTRRYNRH